jgi:hypothetical protein
MDTGKRLSHAIRRCWGGFLIGCAAVTVCVLATGSSANSAQQIPLLSGGPLYSVEFDMPKAVQDRAIREQKKALAAYRGMTIGEPTRQAGCRPTDFPGSLGPPAPAVTARVIGYHVVLVVRFKTMPSALACRPHTVSVAISGKPIHPNVGGIPWVERYALQGSAGRGVIRLPMYAVAPYKLGLYAETIQGRRSKRVDMPLACPSGGCVAGEAPSAHQKATHRKFPLRGVSRSQLEASFREGIDAAGRTAPYMRHAVSCRSRTLCEATFTDPLFPRDPMRVRYVIGGEQVEGCWAVTDWKQLDEPPYEDVLRPSPSAGCVRWPI